MRHLHFLKRSVAEPFRIFFPFGCAMGILFMGVWPLYVFLGLIDYPGLYHSFGITSLFIGSFAVGFLLTALPRFTATKSATTLDVLFLICICLFELVFLVSKNMQPAYLMVALKFSYIMIFAARRVRQTSLPLPPSFIWIGFGLFGTILGATGLFFQINDGFTLFFRALLLRGFLTGLFIGVGGRLMPFLTGISVLKESNQKSLNHFVLASIFFMGLGIETLVSPVPNPFGLLLEASSLFCELTFLWGLYHLPSRGSRPIVLWVSSWLLFIGPLLSFLWPAYNVHLMHLTFIGCFAAGTIGVASHVSVSHRGLSQDLLVLKWPLGFIWTLLFAAAITRALAPMADYTSHLGYAGILAVPALLIWAWYFMYPKI